MSACALRAVNKVPLGGTSCHTIITLPSCHMSYIWHFNYQSLTDKGSESILDGSSLIPQLKQLEQSECLSRHNLCPTRSDTDSCTHGHSAGAPREEVAKKTLSQGQHPFPQKLVILVSYCMLDSQVDKTETGPLSTDALTAPPTRLPSGKWQVTSARM